MTNLEQIAGVLFDAIVNLDPQEFEAIAGAAGRFKTEGSLQCPACAPLFGAIERAVLVTDPTFVAYHQTELPSVHKANPAEDAGTYLRAVTGRPERRNIQNRGRRHSDHPLRLATG